MISRKVIASVLTLRARGGLVGRIATATGLAPEDVAEIIADANDAGDGRALSDHQALEVRRALAEPHRHTRALLLRMALVARLRAMAVQWRVKTPNAASGYEHLADLYEHHGRHYPSHVIPPADDVRAVLAASATVFCGSALNDF